MDHPLTPDRYSLAFELHHEELIPFVRQNLRRPNVITVSYYGLTILTIFWMAIEIFAQPTIDAGMAVLSSILLGFAPTLLLVPLHELIHGIAYRMAGAPSVQYTANWRKFYFTAQADKFVVGAKSFYFIAFAPIALISVCIMLLMPFTGLTVYYALLGTLFVHTAMCSGDFAIASYLHEGRKRHMLTYDDVPNHRSYFFILSSPE